jgi:uncharacterized protein YbjT (DUF2867 family)
MAQTTLVIGGTGHTGRLIVQKLMQHGQSVRVLARNTTSARGQLSKEVEIFEGDITRADEVALAMRNVTGCIVIVESSNSDASPNGPRHVHYEGIQHVLAAAESMTQIVLVTQIYITRPERYPEVHTVIHWRGMAEQAARASGQPYTIVRPGWLTDEPGSRVAIRFEQGDTGEGQISRQDVAEVCVQSLLHAEARGKTFEIYNEPGTPSTQWDTLLGELKEDQGH